MPELSLTSFEHTRETRLATVTPVSAARSRRVWLVAAAALLAAAVLFSAARLTAVRYHDDSLWANALASLGGTQRPGDFGYVFLPAANEVLDGRDPYMTPDDFKGPPQAPYAYPPVLAFAVTPLTLPPEEVHGIFVPGVLFVLLLVAATIAGLWLLDVRDWRCYPVASLAPVTLEGFEYGAIGPVLLLLIAIGWRYRDRVATVGAATGGAVVLKLFLWPLLIWLVLTRRIRAAVAAAATAVGLGFVSWAVIGFGGIDEYPRLLRRLADVEAENSYSVFAILRTIGAPELLARVLVLALGGALLVLAWHAARGQLDPVEGDRRSLTLVIAAALVLTPILWLHYLVLLFVPIALARPRLSGLWFVPLALTVFEAMNWYRGWPAGEGKALASVAVCVVIVFVSALRSGRGVEPVREAAPAGTP